jgi:hypothetical protein
MARTILAGNLAIILGALIRVFDHHRNRRAGGSHGHAVFAQKNARQHAHLIQLAALGGVFGLTRLALVEIGLNFGFGKGDAGRATIHDATQRETVAFAPGGYAEQMTETIMRHARRLTKMTLGCPGGKP